MVEVKFRKIKVEKYRRFGIKYSEFNLFFVFCGVISMTNKNEHNALLGIPYYFRGGNNISTEFLHLSFLACKCFQKY